ncbi:MAG TPA: transglycosylase domain-containing protein [Pseudonocardiaceae bacterium]|jgi:membrane peptidoglycan carboxypeptidase|nr:transglycosylase domain-containing protein [Pseudonocardiaceae bacterium]
MVGLCLLAGVLLAGVMAPVFIGVGSLSNQVSDSVDSISADFATAQVPLVTTVTDSTGAPIAYLFDQYRLPVTFNQISPNMSSAIIAVEDKRFYSESGIDFKGAMRAALNNSSGGDTQGASTITQQYVKNYLVNIVDRNDKAAQAQDQAADLARKIREAKIAMQLDQTMSKNDILTGYLNVVAFGSGGVGPFGVGAAAKAYFGTTADKLTVPQAALLAGMVNNPILYNPYKFPQEALTRRNLVIDRMVQNNALSEQDATAAKATPLDVLPGGPDIPSSTCYGAAPDAGFFCDYALEYLEEAGFTKDQINSGGYTIKTTMDPNISNIAKNSVDGRVATTANGVANTFVILRPGSTSHDLLALVANRNYGTDASAGETTTNLPADVSDPFGAGSTFKLTTLAAAMENGVIGLNDSTPNPKSGCFQFLDPRYNKPYCASNDDATNPDPIPIRVALAISPNTAFVGLEQRTGMAKVLDMAYRLGLRKSLDANWVGGDPNSATSKSEGGAYAIPQMQYFQTKPSFTLGTAALSPMELANVGATLDSGGMWCAPNPIASVTDRYGKAVPVQQQPCEQVIPAAEANTIVSGMGQDTTSQGTSGAAAAAANWTRPTAAKTGTTQQNESVGFLAMVDGYATSSIVFADGSHPGKICNTTPPRLATDGSCGGGAFGGTVAAPTMFNAFNQILAGQGDIGLPGADPAYLNGSSGKAPIVPYVVGQQAAAATQALQAAGYTVVTKEYGSSAPSGQVVGQTPQGNTPTGTQITLYVSTGALPVIQNAVQSPASGSSTPSTSPSSGGG